MSNNQKDLSGPWAYPNVYAFFAAALANGWPVQFNRTWVYEDPEDWEDFDTLKSIKPAQDLTRHFVEGRFRFKPQRRTVTAYVVVSPPDGGGQRLSSCSIFKEPVDVASGYTLGTLTYEEEV